MVCTKRVGRVNKLAARKAGEMKCFFFSGTVCCKYDHIANTVQYCTGLSFRRDGTEERCYGRKDERGRKSYGTVTSTAVRCAVYMKRKRTQKTVYKSEPSHK